LLQQQVDFHPGDSTKIITYRQHKLGVDLLVRCLQQFESLAVSAYHKIDCPSNNYIAPGLTHYLKERRWLKRRNLEEKRTASPLRKGN
jgi:hypothetical protein